jgi:septum site-determining protein MinD
MGFKNAVAGAQHAIIVCTPEVSAVRDADRVVGLLPSEWRPQLIVNRVRPQLVKKGKMLSVEDVNSILRLPLLGVIADEPDVITSTNKGQPLATDPNSPVGAAYRAIAAKLAGEDIPAPTVRIEGNGLFERLGSFFGGRA